MNTLFRRSARRKIYADLMSFDDHLLRDIGLTRADVNDLIAGRSDKVVRTHE